jgi:hypothetical protein
VVELAEDILFSHDVLLLVLLENVLLLQDFHRKDLLGLLGPHQQHLGVGALPDD